MRRFAVVLALLPLPLPLAAQADCAGEITGMFTGGAFDPLVRPNRREVSVSVAPDGSETALSDVTWDGAARSMNCTAALCVMQVEDEMWMRPAGAQAWMAAPSQLPEDPVAFARIAADQMAANVSEADCSTGELNGKPVRIYRYRTKTEPNEFGAWFGGLVTAYVDAASGQMIRREETESVSHFAPSPGEATVVTEITYDDTIAITRPEG